ncbi:MAG: PorV/PorQ family protein [Elusimicrobia bacterium]|nr:PorV/PorQ family protein [Elusimicrobiota bacterium]
MKIIMAAPGIVLAGLIGAQPALAAGAGTTAAEFLRFGVGQPAIMSDASGACQRGATALYWNPAGLADSQCMDAYAAHYGLPGTVSYDFAGLVLPIRRGVFEGGLGLSLQMLSQGDLMRVDNTGTRTGDFSAGDFAAGAAWGGMFGPFRGGLGFKFIRQNIDDSAGSAVALDAGVQRDMGKWSVGAAVTNLGSSLKVGSTAFKLPATLRAGATYEVVKRLTLASDMSVSNGQGTRLHGGALFKLAGPISIGAGYTTGQGEDGPSGLAAGMRLSWNNFIFDASYRPFGEIGNAMQIGVGARFGCPKAAPPAPPAPPAASVLPVPVDSDGDGVRDSLDKCPGTSAGTIVDAAGCPLDSDADGVPDYLDKCPGTPAAVAVDTVGCPSAPVAAVVPEALNPACPWEQADKSCQLDIEFDYDKAELKGDFAEQLKKIAVYMSANPGARLDLRGYTDDHGEDEYNINLSKDRAEAVQKYLVQAGALDAGRLLVKGMGKSQPIASNETEEGRKKNRRVTAVLAGEPEPAAQPVAAPPAEQPVVAPPAVEPAPPAAEPKTAVEPKPAAELKVTNIKIAQSISGGYPQGTADKFDPNVGRLYCWTAVKVSPAPGTIKHVWYNPERRKALTVKLPVQPVEENASWRTWSTTKVYPGKWKVEVTDENGNVLDTITFMVGEP